MAHTVRLWQPLPLTVWYDVAPPLAIIEGSPFVQWESMLRKMNPMALQLVNQMPYARLHLAERHARQRDPVLRVAFFIYANYVRALLGKFPRMGCECCGYVGSSYYYQAEVWNICLPCFRDFRIWQHMWREESDGEDAHSRSSDESFDFTDWDDHDNTVDYHARLLEDDGVPDVHRRIRQRSR